MVVKRTAILWIRNDFRLNDNLALIESLKYDRVIPTFVWDKEDPNPWHPGAASKWWLHHTLLAFKKKFKKLASDLIFLHGNPQDQILKLAKTIDASEVLWNNSHNPFDHKAEKSLQAVLNAEDIGTHSVRGSLLCSTDSLLKKDGSPYLVYTPFWQNFLKKYKVQHLSKPQKLPPLPAKAKSLGCSIDSFGLLPSLTWHKNFHHFWIVGEKEAERKLKTFISGGLKSYDTGRNLPFEGGTSKLSPHLHFGEIHPQRILYEIKKNFGDLSTIRDSNIIQFCKEILWREFSYHLIHHFPQTPLQPFRDAFKIFPWKKNKKLFNAWTKGQTGYPVVDAGMRQLWKTGWMHNRVRMITASFLIKHLGIPWQEGARWFWDTLVDADLASNTQGWQWTAGCGADAAPFFRIFNPITQGEKFDPQGLYAARWCPELSSLPPRWIYRPWEASVQTLKEAGVILGTDYPYPIVDHKEAREQALWNYNGMRGPKAMAAK